MDVGARASHPERSERVYWVHGVRGSADGRVEAGHQPLLCVGDQLLPARLAHVTFPVPNAGYQMLERSHEDLPSRVGRKQVQNAGDRERLVRFVRGRGRVADQQLYIGAPANYALGGREFLRIDGDAEHRSCRATERKQVGQVHMPATEVEAGAAVGCTSSGCQEVVRKKEAWINRRATK